MAQITLKIQKVITLDDVRKFFKELYANNVHFHPDDSLADIVFVETNESVFSEKEAKRLDKLMEKSFEICSKTSRDKIYEIGIEELEIWQKMQKKKGQAMINSIQ